MNVSDRPEFVQKMLDEFMPDFCNFVEDFTKDILNKIPHTSDHEAPAIACGILIRFFAFGTAMTLLDLDARQLKEALNSFNASVKREHGKLKAQGESK